MKSENSNQKKTIRNYRITIVRLAILATFFIFFSFGGYFIGGHTSVVLPIFNCEYVGGGVTRGICIAILDFNKYVSETFIIGMIVCIISMIMLGRLWCGYVCPFGFFQDIVTIIRQKLNITQVAIPQQAKPFITIFKWFTVFYILFYDFCKVCPIQYFTVPITGYTIKTSDTSYFWAVVLLVFIVISDRAFCRVCPLGALMGMANRISGSRLKKKGSACTHCRACIEVCPMDIQEIYEDRENEDITHPECLYCMKCIEVCPENDALRFELFKFKLLKSVRPTEQRGNSCKKN
ncbi:hypothetical protein AN639_04600 [Candidatus Epulonipiscium fishelsonii]|uniref:Uncharacterized protein n=1 Tax=Candidatus Epulonipiscium fishelsonii TaxID=77094 RepID=A0ACC8XEE7_9FIRM|nr:hypothetical protein AN639_04600 [Epulopiscium sp. SCG-B05WGA-EpuloA1]ONI41515.1 hypothetical protein AN396_03465 [Epulopiscium sp. SCG-B11WGA-EpuloA1]